jgi:hypothetical protein
MEPKQRNRAPATRRHCRVPARGTDVEFGEELGQAGSCKANDVGCWANHRLLGDTKGLPGYGLRRGNRG